MKKTGRPPKYIDKAQFESLCGLQCTEAEICAFFDVTDKTITKFCKGTYGKSFSEVFREKRSIGNVSLRRAQMKLAEKNAAMAIWLGKQYLDQREPEAEIKVSNLDLFKSIMDNSARLDE